MNKKYDKSQYAVMIDPRPGHPYVRYVHESDPQIRAAMEAFKAEIRSRKSEKGRSFSLKELGALAALADEISKNTDKSDEEATNALTQYLIHHPGATRDMARAWLRENGHNFTGNGFQYGVWRDARRQVGLSAKANPGRPKKNR
jgi:hypothetical protein